MLATSPTVIQSFTTAEIALPDRAFVCFASPERRCLGALSRASDYIADQVCVFRIEDEPNAEREANLRDLIPMAERVGTVRDIPTRHSDPIVGLDRLISAVRGTKRASGVVTIDISTFPKNSLLLTLRALEMVQGITAIRVLYTEPEDYCVSDRQGRSFGMRGTRVVPTFSAPFRPNEELVLVMVLGFEGDRAMGMWQRLQPHRTLAALGRPAYRSEWEGFSKRINAPLLATLDEKDIHFVDPRDPWSVYDFLVKNVVRETKMSQANYFIAPLGTKPETVGVYLFYREFPEVATIVYAAPIDPQHQYIAKGTGASWILATWHTQQAE